MIQKERLNGKSYSKEIYLKMAKVRKRLRGGAGGGERQTDRQRHRRTDRDRFTAEGKLLHHFWSPSQAFCNQRLVVYGLRANASLLRAPQERRTIHAMLSSVLRRELTCTRLTVQDSSLVRKPDSRSKDCEFASRQERRENFLLQSQLCVLILVRCPFHPPCYCRGT